MSAGPVYAPLALEERHAAMRLLRAHGQFKDARWVGLRRAANAVAALWLQGTPNTDAARADLVRRYLVKHGAVPRPVLRLPPIKPLQRQDWRERVPRSRQTDHLPSVFAGVRVFRDGHTEPA